MKRKLTNNNGSSITVGLDVGYGYTKAITDAQSITFPSVLGYAREIKFMAGDTAKRYPGDQLSDDDGDWFIGELAHSQLSPGEVLSLRGRTANESELGNVFRARLAKAALGKLLPSLRNGDVVHVTIATGLPVDHMRDAGELKAALVGQHRIKTDITDFVANVSNVMVMPQPYGTIYRHMLQEDGKLNPCHSYERTGVVDVGRYTVDVTLDDDGEYIDSMSGSAESGVHIVQQRLSDAYEADYREKPSLRTVDSILKTGCVKVNGKTIDYSRVRDEAIEPLVAATMNLLSRVWRTAADVDVIYVSGGGAELVASAIKSAYPQAVLTDNAQTANAQGYLSYARFAAE